MQKLRYSYVAFGQRIRSEVMIPELTSDNVDAGTVPDICIVRGQIPGVSSHARAIKKHAWISSQYLWLKFSSTAQFLISNDGCITLGDAFDEKNIECRFYLLGGALACALARKNILPLHGCAIAVNDQAYLFLGSTGSGKSTLAARLQQINYPVLSDDICALRFEDDGSAKLLVAYPHMKLNQHSLKILNIQSGRHPQPKTDRGKTFIRFNQSYLNDGYSLRRIYVLSEANTIALRRIDKIQCLNSMVSNTHRKAIYQAMYGAAHHFKHCARVLRQVKERYCFARPMNINQFDQSVKQIVAHVRYH